MRFVPRIRREWFLLLGSLLIVGALYNHYLGHSAYLVDLTLVIAGLCLALLSLKDIAAKAPEKNRGLLFRILSRFISVKQASVAIPVTGFCLILVWSAWKLIVVGESNLRMNDMIMTLLGLSLVLYSSTPTKLTIPKDFAVLYLLFLAIVFVVIWNLYSIVTGESYYRVTAYSEYYFITLPVVSIVRLFGIQANAVLNLSGFGLSSIIQFEYQDRLIFLGIGTGCSGLYSAGLFFSAFLAFVILRYMKFDRYIMTALGLGLIMTWFSNVIRMTMTIMIGSFYGAPALKVFHGYIGVVVFVILITIFWIAIVKWLDRKEGPAASIDSGEDGNQTIEGPPSSDAG